MEAATVARMAAQVLDEKKGLRIEVLDVRELTVITDYMVIASGRSVPQVKALAEHVMEELAKQDVFVRRKEGLSEGHWCVLDYGDVMVHIFHEKDRSYYQLDHLWSNGSNEMKLLKRKAEEPGESE